MIPYATLLGHQPPAPRPSCAAVRTIRMPDDNPAKLPHLDELARLSDRARRCGEMRCQILALLISAGPLRRRPIALQCGLEESVAGDRLAELREQGLADYTRVGRDVTWYVVEEAAA